MNAGMSPEDLAAGLANRALAREDWARAKLAAFAGRSFALTAGPLSATFAIGSDGALAPAPAGAAPALTVTTSPFSLPLIASDPARWSELVENDGDPALAATLGELAQTFPWVVERALASAFGPIAGQAIADAGRSLLGVPAALSKHAASSWASSPRSPRSSRGAPTSMRFPAARRKPRRAWTRSPSASPRSNRPGRAHGGARKR